VKDEHDELMQGQLACAGEVGLIKPEGLRQRAGDKLIEELIDTNYIGF